MHKLLGSMPEGLIFVLSAPAGTGKTTIVELLIKEFPIVVSNVSFTTRPPRAGEISGVHYHFISRKEFEEKIKKNEFLEYVQLYGDYYGTSYQTIRDLQKQGRHVFLVIDTQGAIQIKNKVKAVFIFLKPPSLHELRERLTLRKTETSKVIEERLEWSKREMEAIKEYDYCIVNDNLATAYQVLRSILISETHRV